MLFGLEGDLNGCAVPVVGGIDFANQLFDASNLWREVVCGVLFALCGELCGAFVFPGVQACDGGGGAWCGIADVVISEGGYHRVGFLHGEWDEAFDGFDIGGGEGSGVGPGCRRGEAMCFECGGDIGAEDAIRGCEVNGQPGGFEGFSVCR